MFNEWYLTRDSSNDRIVAYPTELTGIEKFSGCHYFAPTTDLDWCPGKGSCATQWGLRLRPIPCKKIFGHCPKNGELLCVKKTRKGWKSEKIDLDFSN